MTTTCHCPRPHIRREHFCYDPPGVWSWCAAIPGQPYLAGHGLHFYTWEDALAYVVRCDPRVSS